VHAVNASPDTPLPAARSERPPSRLRSIGLAYCALLSGAAVMVYEFLAVRFLQRYFGGSLDVWGSVVAVCLAGLSLGYIVGGMAADRFGSGRTLGVALLMAGLTGFFMEALAVRSGAALLQYERGLVWHPHVAATVSSFLPIFALGGVLPQVIRLQVSRLDRVGSAAGGMAAISTAGSIAGVLLTTMVLLPRVGVRETLYGTSALLVLTGLALLPFGRKRLAAALLLVFLWPLEAPAQIRYDDYSSYHHILVQDRGNERILRFDTDVQSTMSLRDPYAGGFEYTDFFHLPMVFNPATRSVLFLGLGGGTGPKAYLRHYPEVQVHVAEIDPQVVEVAKKFFAVPEDKRLNIAIQDGRVHLQRSRQSYGAIICDAYASGPYGAYLPSHLVTREFFRLAWDRLEHGGSLVYNVIGVYGGRGANDVRDVRATLGQIFQVVYTFQARSSYNTVLVAVKLDPAKLLKTEPEPDPETAWPNGPLLQHPLDAMQLNGLVRTLMGQGRLNMPGLDERVNQFSKLHFLPFQGRILTDNYAPMDLAPGRRR
jgi:spermidine synthase